MRTEGLRLTDLADRSGVSIGFLSELRSGTKTRTSPATARKIADALGVRITAITIPEAAA
jgi:transcriptional regulator with XRE-family HTH domain